MARICEPTEYSRYDRLNHLIYPKQRFKDCIGLTGIKLMARISPKHADILESQETLYIPGREDLNHTT